MKDFLIELKLRDNLLFWFGVCNFLSALVFLALSRVTTNQILGISAWIKPFKFALSIGIYSWTMAWFISYLPDFNKDLFGWTIVLLFGFEIFYITFQAARGELSHFNTSTSLYYFLYMVMAFAATAVTFYTTYVGLLLFTKPLPQLPLHYLWSIRLGILLFVIFSFEGFLMGARLSHTVGGADGSIGLPLLNWSIKYGDLRIAHFVGMHALQILPLVSFYLLRNSLLTFLLALAYAGVATLILITALQGKPLIKTSHYERETFSA